MIQSLLIDPGQAAPALRLPRFDGSQVGYYRTILADPPWEERGAGKIKRGADRHYPLMDSDEIAALPVGELASPAGCHLYLCVTNNFLPDGIDVLRSWGFRYVTCLTWAKDKIGIGQYFRGQTEQILFGVMGQLPYKHDESCKRCQGSTLITAPRSEHSVKPPELRQVAELVSYEPRIELFARRKVDGWHVWGNQVRSDVVLVPLPVEPERQFILRGLQ